jgi:hypothetical protein
MGIGLHAGIIAIHGLWSFSTVMFGALVLYLRPPERAFEVEGLLFVLRRVFSAALVAIRPTAPARAESAS